MGINGCPGMLVRASIGTLALLGLIDIRLDARPRTAYLLQYSKDGCLGSCLFCPQGRAGRRPLMVSRIPWPSIDAEELASLVSERRIFERICIQGVLKPGFAGELALLAELFSQTGVPLSIAPNPVGTDFLREYSGYSDMLGVGLDAATPRVFRLTRKPYSWKAYWWFIERGVEVYGKGRVYVHLIAGLGEKEDEMAQTMNRIYRMGGRVALFAYTPVKGLPPVGSRPDTCYYRRLQALNYLLAKGYRLGDGHVSLDNGVIRFSETALGELDAGMLLTSGCPSCNRPFYNEGPRGPIYNYPDVSMLPREPPWICLEGGGT